MSSTATFTIDEYERMIACGAFVGPSAKHLELIRGELRMMSPQGAAHGEIASRLCDWSYATVAATGARIRVQSSIECSALESQPEPDLVWVQDRSYAQRRPQPADVLLLIEVADSSLDYDLGEKLQLYNDAEILEYWVVDLTGQALHIFREPHANGYQFHDVLRAGAWATPLRASRASLDVANLFSCLSEGSPNG